MVDQLTIARHKHDSAHQALVVQGLLDCGLDAVGDKRG
ncbi:hypothetical protein HNP48_001728 [Acidovorax soli]|uniref:Uncharacterized protein n=1 Tax=Acidovorax soli TaxID=592050 RepID=A0A7X0U8R2_9BURK|nr:hypothetical protein [Acidovorax soli]